MHLPDSWVGGTIAGMRRVHLTIIGRVQGVAYRASAARVAERQGLFGWVRNRRDGAVEAVAEGEDEDIERFVAWCRRGPPMASVEDVRARDEEPRGESGFRVLATL